VEATERGSGDAVTMVDGLFVGVAALLVVIAMHRIGLFASCCLNAASDWPLAWLRSSIVAACGGLLRWSGATLRIIGIWLDVEDDNGAQGGGGDGTALGDTQVAAIVLTLAASGVLIRLV